MITLAQATSQLLESVACSLQSEHVDVMSALGRVVSTDLSSSIDIPPSDNSAMDGFAVQAASVESGASLPVSQRVPAGAAPTPLQPGTAARIFTGGVMPEDADAVVVQENCVYDNERVTFRTTPASGDNVRPRGQDILAGATVVKQGQRLTAIDLSLLASIGVTNVPVYERLRVAVFSTGDELVEPGKALKPGQIYNSNRPLLMGLCRQLGFEPLDYGIVADTYEATRSALQQAAAEADVIVSSGGVSVGEEDHVKPAVESLGTLNLWKVQMKPGKPVAVGEVQDVPFIGLPGNPVSSFVVFQLLAKPMLSVLQGCKVQAPRAFMVTAGFDKPTTSREEYIRVKVMQTNGGEWTAERFANSSSGIMSSLSWADGLVRQPIDRQINKGEAVAFLPLTEGML